MDRHTPVRSCIGCRERRPSAALVRVTRSTERDPHGTGSTIVVDGPSSGRGAWLCRSATGGVVDACLDLAIRREQFGRAWRSTVTSDDIKNIRAALPRGTAP